MKTKLKLILSIIAILGTVTLFAGSNSQLMYKTIQVNNNPYTVFNGVSGGPTLNNIKTKEIALTPLTKMQQAYLKEQASKILANTANAAENQSQNNESYTAPQTLGSITYASGLQQAINNMPVLDQGQTGTCATFSTTEALDILCGNSTDYYNILDNLYIGAYLSSLNTSYLSQEVQNQMNILGLTNFPNPWNGSCENLVLAQYKSYGCIVGEAPNDNNGNFANNDETQMIDPLTSTQVVIPSFTYQTLYVAPSYTQNQTESYAQQIEGALHQGKLVVIGIPVDDSQTAPPNGMSGEIYPDANNQGQYDILTTVSNEFAPDVWTCTNQIASDIENNIKGVGGHAILVTGYITNPQYGNFFIIRNSWGADNGTSGNDFISFDYVNNFSTSATAVWNA